jgi:carbon-monoxide dehydrogenase medium subunit
VIPATFEYERVESVDAAIAALQADDGARLLAGGHSLLPQMKLRFAVPSKLIDIGRLRDLSYVREADAGVAIGALTRYRDLEMSDAIHDLCPIVASVAGRVGDPQVRHMGTIGGAVGHADPASDIATTLVALEAELAVRGPGGDRTVPARDFFKSPFEPDVGPQELVTEVRVPKITGVGWAYLKFHPRAQDWAIVGVAALVERSNGGIGKASVALTNMGPTPLRATSVEQALAGGEDVAQAARGATEGTSPVDDAFASSEYRRYLAPILVRRAIEEAMGR